MFRAGRVSVRHPLRPFAWMSVHSDELRQALLLRGLFKNWKAFFNMSSLYGRTCCCLLATLILAGAARADDPSLKPEIQELAKGALLFDGNGTWTLRFPTPLTLADGITFETWILPNWRGDIAVAPCIMALRDGQTTRFTLRLSPGRDAIIVQSGDKAGTYAVKLEAEKISHLAVTALGDFTEVTVNGDWSGPIDFAAPTGHADTLELGGCSGAGAPFAGSLAEARLWNFAVGVDDIISFLPVTGDISDQDHTYDIYLRAQLTDLGGKPGLIERNGDIAEAWATP
jgi:hypothetical protein